MLQIFSEGPDAGGSSAHVPQGPSMLPRLTTRPHNGRRHGLAVSKGSSGGAYLRGAGESQLEWIGDCSNEHATEQGAGFIERKRTQSREKRKTDDRLPLVCLVGYTNAGKTSLLNALAEQAQPYTRTIDCSRLWTRRRDACNCLLARLVD